MQGAEKNLLQQVGVPVESYTTTLQGKVIHYIKAGTGKPIILLHGLNLGWGQWYKNIPALSNEFTVFALDLPGSGSSEPIDFTTTSIVKLYPSIVLDFINTLTKDCPISLVGHSIGGWTALMLALNSSVRIDKIALVNSLGFTKYVVAKQRLLGFKKVAQVLSKTVMSPSRKNIESFLKSVLYNPNILSNQLIEYYQQNIARAPNTHPFLLINQLIKPWRVRDEFALQEHLPRISIPCAIFAGKHDPLLPLDRNEPNFHKIPGVTKFIMQKSGHVPPLEEPELFNSLLKSFLKS